MPANTTSQGLTYPVSTDDPNIPADIQTVVLQIEKKLFSTFTSASDRNTKVPSPVDGQAAFLRDTRVLTIWNSTSSTWVDYPAIPPTFSSGTTVPSNASGANGDVFFKV